MDDDGGVKRTPQVLIGEGNGAVNVLGDICRFDGCLGEETAEDFGGETHILGVARVNTGNQCPGKLPIGGRSKLLCLGMLCDKGLVSLLRSRIVGCAWRYPREYLAHLL